MAAATSSPYRPPSPPYRAASPPYLSPPLSNITTKAGPSSSSPAPPASKKQQDVAAGRRRWEEIKKKRAQKASTGPEETAAVASRKEDQSVGSSSSGTLSAFPVSNGHVSGEGSQNDVGTSRSDDPSAAEKTVVPEPSRQDIGKAASANSETRLQDSEEGFDSKEFSSHKIKDINTVKTATADGTLPSSISSSGARSNSGEASGGFSVSLQPSLPVPDRSKNRFGMSSAPIGTGGPIVVPAPASTTPSFPSYLEAPIPGNAGPDKAARPSSFPQLFSASQAVPSLPLPTTHGGSLVHTNDGLFSNRGRREEARPPSSMEPEQELVSSAMSVRFPASVPDGTSSRAGLNAPFPSMNGNWRTPNSGIDRGAVSPAVNDVFGLVHPTSRISENFAPFSLAGSAHLPLPPPRYHPPWFSIAPHSTTLEPSLPASLSNGPEMTPPKMPTQIIFDGAVPSSVDLPSLHFSRPNPTASITYENGTLEPSSRPPSWSSSSVTGPPTPVKNSSVPKDPPWQLPPANSSRDDFAMLEQHIEDLTQEKFSLQRGLDAARALAETLAQENSALTEDYNKQGALVNEFKEEMERLKGEIRAQDVVVRNVISEKDRALQECKAAVERAQALAAEVIALEEKVLKSRSQELKLQRERESLAGDAESQKRQVAALDKDRANLRSLVEALQEEKTLLQAHLRKAVNLEELRPTTSDTPAGAATSTIAQVDVSTSTEDLELEAFLTAGTAVLPSTSQHPPDLAQGAELLSLDQQYGQPAIMPSVQTIPVLSLTNFSQSSELSSSIMTRNSSIQPSASSSVGTRLQLGGRSLHLSPGSAMIPEDQVGIVENINTLISELAEEREALLKALRAESVGASQLRALNAELSQKLEMQTQRLELAVAQSMAHASAPTVENETYETSRLGPVYVDEGDEVVDRVLGWIMHLFPSGSSRRKRL
ncbi:hypothetical protein R1sor_022121 [Riccia sorocarpa]|uniref:Uncharacterized protein n=1 Tax=Riccia sorocarpa TaxID=122646 RepID=A0ABD3GMA7_9MARC